ncbi:Predicted ATPase [Actinobacillus lignieresii]|uniref:AAA family ATPase n=1 Tax=Actinobacillus lignieresii TaxID=720 RepID=UPI000E17158A|nr:ATP-binding protein [Actinobacillus lignieresii]SUT98560.1 Predicted ATPase [Actinobacillus lignieresii]
MLKKFSVYNYRQFNETLEFDLTASNYTFNTNCIKRNLVKLALVYGENGVGKSTLGWAIFDLVSHLTDNENNTPTENILNAFSKEKYANFKFEFSFLDEYEKSKELVYEYQKDERNTLISEKVMIGDELVLDYQLNQPFFTNLTGTEHLNRNINPVQNLSAIKYIYSNSSLDRRNYNNAIFSKFMDFVGHILYFRSVFEGKVFAGYNKGLNNIEQDILTNGNLKGLETFLSDFGLNLQLINVRQLNKSVIGVKMGDKVLPFFDIVSTGTLSLTFFYYWWQSIKENKIPLLFIDEFDCSYHFSLSEKMVEKLKQLPDTQVILTTHNTNLLSNELIRPDCGFVIDGKKIKSLNHLTQKEIREVHNLEKLYQAGHFNG